MLAELEKVDGIDWIRLMYFYPMYIDDPLIAQIASSEKVLPYLDMPLQHINNTMLRRMARRVTREETELQLEKLRAQIPDLVVRTTFISGFPGETDEQHQELVEFVEQQRFERMGVFTYSLEPDTPAASLPDHLPEDVKNARRDQLMELQQQIAFEWSESKVGSQLQVIVDQPGPEDGVWLSRSTADAPDVDAMVWLTSSDAQPGDIVTAEVVATHGLSLIHI